MNANLMGFYETMGTLAKANARTAVTRSARVAGVAKEGQRLWLDGMTAQLGNTASLMGGLTKARTPSDVAALQRSFVEAATARAAEDMKAFLALSGKLVAEVAAKEDATAPEAAAPAEAAPVPAPAVVAEAAPEPAPAVLEAPVTVAAEAPAQTTVEEPAVEAPVAETPVAAAPVVETPAEAEAAAPSVEEPATAAKPAAKPVARRKAPAKAAAETPAAE